MFYNHSPQKGDPKRGSLPLHHSKSRPPFRIPLWGNLIQAWGTGGMGMAGKGMDIAAESGGAVNTLNFQCAQRDSLSELVLDEKRPYDPC